MLRGRDPFLFRRRDDAADARLQRRQLEKVKGLQARHPRGDFEFADLYSIFVAVDQRDQVLVWVDNQRLMGRPRSDVAWKCAKLRGFFSKLWIESKNVRM
jgi:hypothetical protein